ncbi:MAG: energy transducer TonB [Porticoccaceae bacterium]|nr:energy transducer TonB [Porticoccaceae bacterium]
MRRSAFLLAAVLLVPPVCAEVQMKDENGKYRHHDPAVRKEFLGISKALSFHGEYAKSEKLLKVLVRKWKKAGYQEDYELACRHHFIVNFHLGGLENYQENLKDCSKKIINNEFLILADKSNPKNAIGLYQKALKDWAVNNEAFWLKQACQKITSLYAREKMWADINDLKMHCEDSDVELELINASSDNKVSLRRSSFSQILEYYLYEWPGEKTLEKRNLACGILARVYFPSKDPGLTEPLMASCGQNIMEKTQVQLVQSEIYSVSPKKAVKILKKYISEETSQGNRGQVIRMCQILYWFLSEKNMDFSSDSKYMNLCPEEKYARSREEAGSIPELKGYLLVDINPSILKRPTTRYPESALIHGLEGYAVVQFTVNVDGTISNPKVIDSFETGYNGVPIKETTIFNKEAIKSAKKLRFRPRIKNGKPEEFITTYQFTFELEK